MRYLHIFKYKSGVTKHLVLVAITIYSIFLVYDDINWLILFSEKCGGCEPLVKFHYYEKLDYFSFMLVPLMAVYAFASLFLINTRIIMTNFLSKTLVIINLLLSLYLLIAAFRSGYEAFGIYDVSLGKVSYNAVECMYFSIITWTTVGYGDFVPTAESRIIASIEAICGYIFMAIFISLVIKILIGGASERDI